MYALKGGRSYLFCLQFLPRQNDVWFIALQEGSQTNWSARLAGRRVRPRPEGSGSRLSSSAGDVPTEEQQRAKENNDVKVLYRSEYLWKSLLVLVNVYCPRFECTVFHMLVLLQRYQGWLQLQILLQTQLFCVNFTAFPGGVICNYLILFQPSEA